MRIAIAASLIAWAALVIGILAYAPHEIDLYRVVDDRTIAVISGAPWLSATNVTSVTETPTTITIGMRSLYLPLPGTGGPEKEFQVQLLDPLDGRAVIDASTGQQVHQVP